MVHMAEHFAAELKGVAMAGAINGVSHAWLILSLWLRPEAYENAFRRARAYAMILTGEAGHD